MGYGTATMITRASKQLQEAIAHNVALETEMHRLRTEQGPVPAHLATLIGSMTDEELVDLQRIVEDKIAKRKKRESRGKK